MLEKIHNLTPLQVLGILFGVALIVFSIGLKSPFIGDDFPQIVNNAQVHSLHNIPRLFTESTFANGPSESKLSGAGYRPIMMVTFSVLYTLFGPHPAAFHIFLLLVTVANAFLLFLVLRYFIPSPWAFGLALVFLVNPFNSQVVFSIPVTQDALFFFFGITGIWTLLRFQDKSLWYLGLSAFCLLLSALSKEVGLLFLVLALVYTWVTNRKRFYILLGLAGVLLAIYLPLRLHAVGLANGAHNAPIEDLNLGQRLLNAPELVMFYVTRFVFPLHLAQAYYWTHTHVSFTHFILPLLFDALLVYAAVLLGRRIHQRDTRLFMVYCFFAIWFIIGMLPNLQIIPFDMTASESWFYLPVVGFLGMIGAAVAALLPRHYWKVGGYVLGCLVLLYGVRTFARGFDWQSQTKLAYRNIAVSKEDYVSYNLIANDFLRNGNYEQARAYAARSIAIYPFGTNYNTLGGAETYLGHYPAAVSAFKDAIKYGGDDEMIYQNIALLYALYDDPAKASSFYAIAILKFPDNATLWFYTAVFANSHGYRDTAKQAIARAHQLGDPDQEAYAKIMNGEPFTVTLGQAN